MISKNNPAHTNDHYMHYYIGLNDGQTAMKEAKDVGAGYSSEDHNSDYKNYTTPQFNSFKCPSHTSEYCAGYNSGGDLMADTLG
jgi:hypothetical protein